MATSNRGKPKPLCLCGCGERVRQHSYRYAHPSCVPASVRGEAAKKGRRNFAMKRRAALFRHHLQRIEHRVTREDLLSIFMDIYRQAYQCGHRAAAQTYVYGPLRKAKQAA